jgi:hypothetical protein
MNLTCSCLSDFLFCVVKCYKHGKRYFLSLLETKCRHVIKLLREFIKLNKNKLLYISLMFEKGRRNVRFASKDLDSTEGNF